MEDLWSWSGPELSGSVALCDRSDLVRDLLEALRLGEGRLTERQLDLVATTVGEAPALWADLVAREEPALRERVSLHKTDNLEVLLLIWPWNESSDWHDHGGSSGAYSVVKGCLVERYRDSDGVSVKERLLAPGSHGGYGASHVHELIPATTGPAVSVHAFSPPFETVAYYEQTLLGFVARAIVPQS
jgi:hypothetical protein